MAFLGNRTVNLLNLHYGIHALAISGGGAFFAAFLLHAGVPAPAVLASLAPILAGRFAIRPFIPRLATRWGLRPLVIAGTILVGLEYPLLAEVRGIGWGLLALCALSAVGETFYWTCYHAYFAYLGDAIHRGHQIAAREAVAAIIGIVGPLAAGWALTVLGPSVAFGTTAVVLFLSALPLLRTPNVAIARQAPGAMRAAISGMLIFAADGWVASGLTMVWPVALFLSLGQSFTAFGGAMALAALAGAAGGLVLGRLIDAGHGGRAVWLAATTLTVTILLRAASYGNPVWAVAATALGALVTAFHTPAMMTAVYNLAMKSPCALRFHVATEGAWDAGAASGCLASAGLLWAGAPMALGILLSLAGVAAVFVLLRRYYGAMEAEPAAA